MYVFISSPEPKAAYRIPMDPVSVVVRTGDGELVKEKWLSILNHITDVHEGHGDKFPRCAHDEIEDRDWMKKGRSFYTCSYYHVHT